MSNQKAEKPREWVVSEIRQGIANLQDSVIANGHRIDNQNAILTQVRDFVEPVTTIADRLQDTLPLLDRIAAALERNTERESGSVLQVAFDAAISREAVLHAMAKHLATNPDDLIAEEGGARHLAILALSRCYTQEVLEDGSCFDPYTAGPAVETDGQS